MIRQRFNPGRLTRIGAWALAAVTSATALINNQAGASPEEAAAAPEGLPAGNQVATASQALPSAPADGLLVLRYQPSPLPPPPTIVRRVIVEERVAGSAGSTAGGQRAGRSAAPAASSPAPAATGSATPPPPRPAPAPLPVPPPVQSSGS